MRTPNCCNNPNITNFEEFGFWLLKFGTIRLFSRSYAQNSLLKEVNLNSIYYRGGLTMFARKVLLRTRHACHIENKMDQVCLPYKFFGD